MGNNVMNIRKINRRRGVTLLFVISMIVLFLLMGTTFVVVSNDFLRSARQRNRITVNTVESLGEHTGEKLITRALYDLVRGPSLSDANSPLRGHSILGDMYGYGLTAYVKDVENVLIEPGVGASPNPQFIRTELIGPNINLYDPGNTVALNNLDEDYFGSEVLTGKSVTVAKLGTAPGRFNGQLLSFVSGPSSGITARIIDHQVFPDASGDPADATHKLTLMLLDTPIDYSAPLVNDGPNGNKDLIVSYDDVTDGIDPPGEPESRFPTRVVINGRPFVGTGAGRLNPKIAADDSPNQPALSVAALQPNQRGKTRQQLYNEEIMPNVYDGYLGIVEDPDDSTSQSLPNAYAPNESYDAFDFQNMFLSESVPAPNVASFNQRALANVNPPNADVTQYSFRPEFIQSMVDPNFLDARSTCNEFFPDRNNPTASIPFANRPLDVDNDNDGADDGIWMDIGMPMFTNADGRRVKPLVSYRVVDLDSKININVHGNRARSRRRRRAGGSPSPPRFYTALIPSGFLNGTAGVPLGSGFGPSEVNLPLRWAMWKCAS